MIFPTAVFPGFHWPATRCDFFLQGVGCPFLGSWRADHIIGRKFNGRGEGAPISGFSSYSSGALRGSEGEEERKKTFDSGEGAKKVES